MGILKNLDNGILENLDKKITKPVKNIQVDEGVWAKVFTRNPVKIDKPETVIPEGYSVLRNDEIEKLMHLKDLIINEYKIFSYDYETDSDIEDDAQDAQDVEVVSMSFAFKRGQAFYLPFTHIQWEPVQKLGAAEINLLEKFIKDGNKPKEAKEMLLHELVDENELNDYAIRTVGENLYLCQKTYYEYNWDKEWVNEHFLKPILLHPDVILIAHNFQNEHKFNLLEFDIDVFPKTENCKVIDTMYLVKAIAPSDLMYLGQDGWELAVGLKEASKKLLADENGVVHGLVKVDEIKSFKEMVKVKEIIGYYKSGENKGKPKYETSVIKFNERDVDEETIRYGCFDADAALGLYHLLMPVAEREGVSEVLFEEDFPLALAAGELELTGWHVNKHRLDQLGKDAEEKLKDIEKKLHEALIETVKDHARIDSEGRVFVPAGSYPMGEWRGMPVALKIKAEKEFNWGSTQHLQWLFFHVLQIPPKERSKRTGLPSAGKEFIDEAIDKYADHAPLLKVLKEKKKYDKIISTYVKGMGDYVREDTNRIHTNLKRVSTWRWSSKYPNLQNVPRADNDPVGIREIFVAPKYDLQKDYSHLHKHVQPIPYIITHRLSGETMLISCDYSQIELRVLAWYAQEKRMIETLANGGDLHSVVAKEVFNLPCEVHEVKDKYKPYRYRAKKVNFGIVYGMTEFGLSKDPKMGMNVEEAKEFIEKYMATYPGVAEYARQQIEFAREYGYVETMFGHRRNIPEIKSYNKWERKAAENKAMNTPIQGSAADIMNLAIVRIKKLIPERAPYLRMVMQIHDDLLLECPVELAAEGARFVKEVMEYPIPGFTEIMPITAEPAVGKIWAHSLDIKWDEDGTPYVSPKVFEDPADKELGDVTLDMIEYALPLYEKAGIEVRPKWVPKKEKKKSA